MATMTTSGSDGKLYNLSRPKKPSRPGVQCVARAVYDNIAEAPDELAFRKGDVLTVLEQNTGDLEGWWLCSLRGRQGICPGNRLRLMVGVYSTTPAQSPTSPAAASRARSPNFSVSMTSLPQKPGEGYMYDTPKGTSIMNLTQGTYDTPKGRAAVADEYDTPKPSPSPVFATYDVPRPHRRPSPEPCAAYDTPKCPDGAVVAVPVPVPAVSLYDVPPSSNRSSGASEMSLCSSSSSAGATHLTSSLSLSSLGSGARSNRSSAELYDVPLPLPLPAKGFGASCPPPPGDGLYDVPPQVTRDAGGGSLRLSAAAASACPCDAPPPSSPASKDPPRELPLQLDAAMDTLVKLQQEVQADCNKLLSIDSSAWRGGGKSEQAAEYRTLHVKDVCHQIRTKLVDFVQFASGASGNAFKLADQAVYNRLNRYVRPLHEANAKVQALCGGLDAHEWSSAYLSRSDELDQLVNVARGLVEDVRQTASFIQGNSTLIFKRSAQRPLPCVPTTATATKPDGGRAATTKEKAYDQENTYENDGKSWWDDYEYVNLEPKEKIEREEEATKASMPADLQKSFDNLLKESRVQVADPASCKPAAAQARDEPAMDPSDRQVLGFYRAQMDKHVDILGNAIAAFLHTIQDNRPPAVFVAHSKFVIVSSHKLMFIGDTVHRNIGHQAARDRVRLKADALCEALQAAVTAIKTAAIEFPAYSAVQDMVGSVIAISQAANDLRSVVKC